MRESRSMNSELQGTKTTAEGNLFSRFQTIIAKQQEVIQSLRQEVLLLKSYISLQKTSPFETNCSQISLNTTVSSSNQSQIRSEAEDILPCLHKQLLSRMAQALEIADWDSSKEQMLVEAIVSLQNKLKSQQPVFIERVKEKKVPVIVQKPVKVQKIIQKIVYVERAPSEVEKRVEKVPTKDKEPEKWNNRRKEEDDYERNGLNKTYSERYIRPRKEEERYYDYQEERPRNQNFKKEYRGDYNNFVRKRNDYGKPYYKKY